MDHVISELCYTKNLFLLLFYSLRPSQQLFNKVATDLPGMNKYLARNNVSCSRTQHSDSSEA